jgi:hypothetical protein
LLERYFPLKPLGSGGFAQIYTIWDEKTQTEKVLKVLVDTSAKALELFISVLMACQKLTVMGIFKLI